MFIILDREITYRGDYMREIGSLPDLSFTSFNKTVKQEVVLASSPLTLSLNILLLYK